MRSVYETFADFTRKERGKRNDTAESLPRMAKVEADGDVPYAVAFARKEVKVHDGMKTTKEPRLCGQEKFSLR